MLMRDLPDQATQGGSCCGEIFISGKCRHSDNTCSIVIVSCLHYRLSINSSALDVLEPTDAIVTTCKNFEHDLAHLVVRLREAACEQVL